jgi:hypothetical protein
VVLLMLAVEVAAVLVGLGLQAQIQFNLMVELG